jgi:hypothetical protein
VSFPCPRLEFLNAWHWSFHERGLLRLQPRVRCLTKQGSTTLRERFPRAHTTLTFPGCRCLLCLVFILLPPIGTKSLLWASLSIDNSVQRLLNGTAMAVFSYLQDIYQLDTLDTRFTNSSTVPYKPARDPADPRPSPDATPPTVPIKFDSNGQPIAQPSKWGTPEFYFYYFVFITIVPYMFWIPYDVSRRL